MGMDHLPTESDLIKLLVHLVVEKRPSLEAVLQHPCLWNDMQRLDLLVGLSNCIEDMGKVCCSLPWSVCLCVCMHVSVRLSVCACVNYCSYTVGSQVSRSVDLHLAVHYVHHKAA